MGELHQDLRMQKKTNVALNVSIYTNSPKFIILCEAKLLFVCNVRQKTYNNN